MENDESWYPTTESLYKDMGLVSKLGRLLYPVPLFAYPFYLFNRWVGGLAGRPAGRAPLCADAGWPGRACAARPAAAGAPAAPPANPAACPSDPWRRSPGKTGSHFDPKCDLFTEAEGPLVGAAPGRARKKPSGSLPHLCCPAPLPTPLPRGPPCPPGPGRSRPPTSSRLGGWGCWRG